MAYRDLRDFVRKLEKNGELKRISAEVDPVLEITEDHRSLREGRRAGAASSNGPRDRAFPRSRIWLAASGG